MPLENKFSRHFFFASRRKKNAAVLTGLAEKKIEKWILKFRFSTANYSLPRHEPAKNFLL